MVKSAPMRRSGPLRHQHEGRADEHRDAEQGVRVADAQNRRGDEPRANSGRGGDQQADDPDNHPYPSRQAVRSRTQKPRSTARGRMSGSPIVAPDGAALGIISTGNAPNPELAADLPGWILRATGALKRPRGRTGGA